MFRYSIRNELTKKYYERRLGKFFEFMKFHLDLDILEHCNKFVEEARNGADTLWAVNQVIGFLQFQKNREENNEITAADFEKFCKSTKVVL